ncbi:MAG: hypothetical protein ABJF11_00675 [Reichenbachiella sp.]|uniref:hypothetical protein n=1 Tax=Reichenbachiella sp. TaxID=2184521 RepID=UPI00326317E6
MNKIYKYCIYLLFVSLYASSTFAQSALTELPFGIIIGKTTNEEIEDRGTCIRKVEENEGNVRCEQYDIAGNFSVLSSQNEVVNKVLFDGAIGNQLPRKWQELGLAFGSQNSPGTLEIDFRNIIKANEAAYINTAVITAGNEEDGIRFKFEIGGLRYEATVITNKAKPNQLGLRSITITEAY